MNDMILILNYSNEFTLEAATRLRAEQVYARVISGATTAEQIRQIAPRGVLLCGESKSASGIFDAQILSLGIPVLALGHAAHMLLSALGGACAGVAASERKANIEYGKSALFTDLDSGERYLEEALTLMLPADVQMTASAGGCTIAFEDPYRKLYGVQFELERNDPEGSTILKNFARDICGCQPWYTMEAALRQVEDDLAAEARKGAEAVCVVSGGVDSTVAALLAHRAFGSHMKAIYLETGLMREGESEEISRTFERLGIPFEAFDRSEAVLHALEGKKTMAQKNAVVAGCLREEMERQTAAMPDPKVIVVGSNYSDAYDGKVSNGWNRDGLTVLHPLSTFFKDEVRAAASLIGLDEDIAQRKPFPLMGLGARILGEVNAERLSALRRADAIFAEEIRLAGLGRRLYKFFPVLADADPEKEKYTIILRAVTLSGGQLMPARLPYDLVERTVARIQEEMPSVVRVFYDQTPTQVGKETFL